MDVDEKEERKKIECNKDKDDKKDAKDPDDI